MNELRTRLDSFQKLALIIGCVACVLCVPFVFQNSRQFFVSYLTANTFWLGLTLGCLAVAMIQHLTGGRWGFVTRRFLEAGFMTLPLMALLFVPLLFGLRELYPWTHADVVAASETLKKKLSYLNLAGFLSRAVLFFSMWLAFAVCLRRWSLQQDLTAHPSPTIRIRTLSGPAIVILPLTATFAFVDWVMSAEPEWFSTIFPVIMLIGQVLSAIAFIIVLLTTFRNESPLRDAITAKHFHDLGNLLLAFVVFWTYVSFSQLLIIYSGNLPREIDWYLHRIAGGWKWVVGFLGLFHFFVPFALLLFRTMKLNPVRLAVIAALIFAVHIAEVFWIVQPTFFPNGIHVHLLDFASVLGLGGIWFAVFAANLKRHPLLPRNDPRIEYPFTQPAHAK